MGRDDAAKEERFAALVTRQARFAYRVAYAVLRNAHDAEDAVQETFMKLYRTGAWEAANDERAFLARAVWRMAVSLAPKRKAEELDVEVASAWATPEQMAMSADASALVHRLIDALPEELRQPLALSTVEEMNSREIAAAMGIPEGTVRTRLLRARSILRQKLVAMTDRNMQSDGLDQYAK